MKLPNVGIVVLTYNQEAETARCLETLKALSYPTVDVWVVDNGSRQSAEHALRDRFPAVRWMTLPENIGFAAGCNRGIREALSQGAEMVLLLNNDAQVEPGFLEKMVSSALAEQVGVVGAVVYRSENSAEPFLAGMQFNFFSTRIDRILPLPGAREASGPCTQDVPCASGSCFLIKKAAFKEIGLLDERFFIYFEETDFCARSRQKGYRVVCDPRVKVVHEEGATFGRESAATRYLYTRNRLLFLSKHCPVWLKPWSFLIRILQDLLRLFMFLLSGEGKKARAIFWGVTDFLTGRFGKGRLDDFVRR